MLDADALTGIFDLSNMVLHFVKVLFEPFLRPSVGHFDFLKRLGQFVFGFRLLIHQLRNLGLDVVHLTAQSFDLIVRSQRVQKSIQFVFESINLQLKTFLFLPV